MNSSNVSTHVFLFYESSGKYLLDELSKIYSGEIYLSLVYGNCANNILLEYAKQHFNIQLVYVDNYGTDQYGFYQSFKLDKSNKPWIFYCHDKHPSKIDWLSNMITTFVDLDERLLDDEKIGIISSAKYKNKVLPFEKLLLEYINVDYCHRKDIVESMHTLIWLHELERILLSKYNLGKKEFKYPMFSAGNVFLIRKEIVEKSHGCVYDEFFNKNIYRADGEVEHGMERFYYYVSSCMNFHNLFI